MIDGGYSDNVPMFNRNTVTVSPFCGDQDICPEDNSELGALLYMPTGPTTNVSINKENLRRLRMALLPPKAEDMLAICRQGFQDAYRYLESRQIIQCATCRAAKLERRLERMEDWRRKQDESCLGCDALLRDAKHLNLSAEIYQVFQEELAEFRLRNSGFLAAVSNLAATPYTVSVHVAARSVGLARCLLPSERTVKALMNLAPDLGACPFAPMAI